MPQKGNPLDEIINQLVVAVLGVAIVGVIVFLIAQLARAGVLSGG